MATFPSVLQLTGSPHIGGRGPDPLDNPITRASRAAQPGASAEEQEQAANDLEAATPSLSPMAQPHAANLVRALRTNVAKTPRQQKVENIMFGDSQTLTTPSRTVELGPVPGSTRVEGPARLEQFQLPSGTLQPGEREAGRIVSSSGSFAKALIEKEVAAGQPIGSLSPEDLIRRRIQLKALKVDDATINQYMDLQLGGAKIPVNDLQDMITAGIKLNGRDRVSQFSKEEYATATKQKQQSIIANKVAVQTELDKLKAAKAEKDFATAPLKRVETLGIIDIDTLQNPARITGLALERGLASGQLIAAPRPADLSQVKLFRGVIPRLFDLARLGNKILTKNPGQNLVQVVDFAKRNALASDADLARFIALRNTLSIQVTKVIQGARPSDLEGQKIAASLSDTNDTASTSLARTFTVIQLLEGIASGMLGVPALRAADRKIFEELGRKAGVLGKPERDLGGFKG